MTSLERSEVCDLCGQPGSSTMEPPRRTLGRGADPDDPSISVIVVLLDVVLCENHADELARDRFSLGWCDDARCRVYGEAGVISPCGDPFKALKR